MSFVEVAPEIAPHEETCSLTNNPPGVHRTVIPLRCFVHANGENSFLAECIDLDISAEGSTLAEAKEGLRDALVGYLSVVCSGRELKGPAEKDVRELILRPSPLSHRIRYYIARMILRLGKRTSDRFYKITAPCHC